MGSGHSAPAAAAAAFAAADANKDGKLDAKELGAAFEQIGVSWGAERVKYLLAALDPGSARGGTQGGRPLCSDRTATPYPRQRPNPPNSSCGISRLIADRHVPGSLQDHRQDFLGTSSRCCSTTGHPSGPRKPLMSSIG